MYGFIGALSNRASDLKFYCETYSQTETVHNSTEFQQFKIERLSINKFVNDKVFYESEKIIVVLEGVVYNFVELKNKYRCDRYGELLEKIYFEKNIAFLANMLNGFFSGVLYDKVSQRMYLISDHITYKPLWYYKQDEEIIFSTDINWLYKTLELNGVQLVLDKDGAYCLLNYGYMLGDITPIRSVRKLLAGKIIDCSFKKDILSFNMQEYYKIPNNNHLQKQLTNQEYDELLKKINKALFEAVDRVYRKDEEYGYKHCCTLSGGLDSRLVLMIACELGYKTTCLTMGESNCPDIVISSKICNDLKLEHCIYELNNGLFLFDMESAVKANGGTILYPGFAHSFRLKSLFNFDQYGAVHTGDLGDLILGGSLVGAGKIDLTSAMYGSEFIDGFSNEFKKNEIERYSDSFHFNYFNRGLNSAGNGCFATQFYTECSSPFIDKDLLNLMFSVPGNLLSGHKLYIDYMKKYLPHSCDYIWEHTGCKPDASKINKKAKRWMQRIQFRVFHKNFSMNPFNKWYVNNTNLKNYLDAIDREGDFLKDMDFHLWNAVKERYNSKNALDKMISCFFIKFMKTYNVKMK